MTQLAEPIQVVLTVAKVLSDLHVAHLVGGSLASSLHGIPRATQDVDIIADLNAGHAEPLTSRLEDDFYVDVDMIRDAIRRRACFNIIHLPTMTKVDIFVCRDDRFQREEMGRRQVKKVGDAEVVVATAEDTVLEKLRWYRSGGMVSDRQWGDVLGILQVQGTALDQHYLRRWADVLGIRDLLDRALNEDQQSSARGEDQ